MSKKAFVSMGFFFNPSETGWSEVGQLENSLAKWLDSLGLEAVAVEAFGDQRMIEISAKQDATKPDVPTFPKSEGKDSLTKLKRMTKGLPENTPSEKQKKKRLELRSKKPMNRNQLVRLLGGK